MKFDNVYIPYGAAFSTPFCKWQTSFQSVNSLHLARDAAEAFFASRGLQKAVFDGLVLGVTVPQKHSFYGAPWLAGMLGMDSVTGPTVSQACATSVRALLTAATETQLGQSRCELVVATDRTSNGPHVYYPDPAGPGGTGDSENPVFDNFSHDPHAKCAMLTTAENVAKECGITKEEQDDVALLRYEQYMKSLDDDRAFQRRYMVSVGVGSGRRAKTIDRDEGVFASTKEGLAALRPVAKDGTVTFGAQTFPADGCAGAVVTTKDRAIELSKDGRTTTQVVSFGSARVGKATMPKATVPAAKAALSNAGIGIADVFAIKTHNPFALNDVYFSREMGVALDRMNNFGCPLVYGHPQAPTGLRAIAELIEELVLHGGGYGLFTGCAAGDTAMAVILKVN
ncbi:MAG: thiolase family protein [Planctomycetes bacterium]|nr:thiolase family protein [Planctomycetota bacterium]